MSLCEFIVKNNRNSHRRCSLEKTVLKNFVIFTGKCLCVKSLFNKVAGLQVCNFIEMRLQHRCFPVNTTKFLRTPILSICERLLLKHCNFFKNSLYEKQKENIPSFFKKRVFTGQNRKDPGQSHFTIHIFYKQLIFLVTPLVA